MHYSRRFGQEQASQKGGLVAAGDDQICVNLAGPPGDLFSGISEQKDRFAHQATWFHLLGKFTQQVMQPVTLFLENGQGRFANVFT